MNDQCAIGSLDAMQFMIALCGVISGARRYFGEMLPRLAVISGFPNADGFVFGPECLPWVEETTVAKLDWSMWAVCGAAFSSAPRDASVFGTESPLTELSVARTVREALMNSVPSRDFVGCPRAASLRFFQEVNVGE